MAELIVTVPDNKIQLVIDWVQSRMSPASYQGWVNTDYVNYVETYLASRLRAEVRSQQLREHSDTFVFDDPVA